MLSACFTGFEQNQAVVQPTPLLGAQLALAIEYVKKHKGKEHVFRLVCADGAEYLFECPSEKSLLAWCSRLYFYAKLPPSQQLKRFTDDHLLNLQQLTALAQPSSSAAFQTGFTSH